MKCTAVSHLYSTLPSRANLGCFKACCFRRPFTLSLDATIVTGPLFPHTIDKGRSNVVWTFQLFQASEETHNFNKQKMSKISLMGSIKSRQHKIKPGGAVCILDVIVGKTSRLGTIFLNCQSNRISIVSVDTLKEFFCTIRDTVKDLASAISNQLKEHSDIIFHFLGRKKWCSFRDKDTSYSKISFRDTMITKLVKSLGLSETTKDKGICEAVLKILSELESDKVKLCKLHETICHGHLVQMHGVLHYFRRLSDNQLCPAIAAYFSRKHWNNRQIL